MLADQLVAFASLSNDAVLAWTRASFLALRYELVGPEGTIAALSVRGIGTNRSVVAETASTNWRIGVFPLDRPEVMIQDEAGQPVASYTRSTPVTIHFASGETYHFERADSAKAFLVNAAGDRVFELEIAEFFPRWRVEIRLGDGAAARAELPLLAIIACCAEVFGKSPFA